MNSTQNKPLQLSSLYGFTDAGDLFYTSKAGAEGGRKSGGRCRRDPPPLCNGARHIKGCLGEGGTRRSAAQASTGKGRGSAATCLALAGAAGAVLPAGGRLPRAEAQRLMPCPQKAGRFDDRKKAGSPLSGANPEGQFREAPFILRT